MEESAAEKVLHLHQPFGASCGDVAVAKGSTDWLWVIFGGCLRTIIINSRGGDYYEK